MQELTNRYEIFEMKVALIGASMNETIGATVMSSETPQIKIRPPPPKPINAVRIDITLANNDPQARMAVKAAKSVITRDLDDDTKYYMSISYFTFIIV